MPNILKALAGKKAEPYEFPLTTFLEDIPEEPISENANAEETAASPPPEQEPVEHSPVSFAQIQADAVLEDAHRQAAEILEQARAAAEEESERIREAARDEGYRAGYQDGVLEAQSASAAQLERKAAELTHEVQEFLDRAGRALDRQMDENVGELRDLALAVAEKIVSVSLKSSSGVIERMIRTAIDKRKRREWVHIYIAECDAKQMGQVPSNLASALAALSDRVRIIPMADDEAGTCVIEMPDEIIDASAATQLSNIRTMLLDTSPGILGNGLF